MVNNSDEKASASGARDKIRDELWAAKGRRVPTLEDKDWQESNTRRKNMPVDEQADDEDNSE